MHKRTAHRWRLFVVLLAGVGFAVGSFWLLTVMQSTEADMQAAALRNEPDYIVEKFSFVRMSEAGQPHYIFSGSKLTHRPVDDISDVVTPRLQAINPGQPVMTMSANNARISNADNTVHLQGDVAVDRPSAAGARNMSLRTDALMIYPDEDRMETDQTVTMDLGSTTVQGKGLQVNNATQQMRLPERSKMTFAPNSKKVQ